MLQISFSFLSENVKNGDDLFTLSRDINKITASNQSKDQIKFNNYAFKSRSKKRELAKTDDDDNNNNTLPSEERCLCCSRLVQLIESKNRFSRHLCISFASVVCNPATLYYSGVFEFRCYIIYSFLSRVTSVFE
jgi:hypothetical protein